MCQAKKKRFLSFRVQNCHLFFSWNAVCSFTLNHFRYFRLFICRLARGHLTFLQLEAQQPLSTIKIIGHCVILLRILKSNWWAILLSFSWQKSVAAQGLLSLLPHPAHRAVFPNLECRLSFLQDICNSLTSDYPWTVSERGRNIIVTAGA